MVKCSKKKPLRPDEVVKMPKSKVKGSVVTKKKAYGKSSKKRTGGLHWYKKGSDV